MGRSVIRTCAAAALWIASAAPGPAADLVWQVENPFRFFKDPAAFALHERAYQAARGTADSPADIIWKTERRLNDPDCADPSSPARCSATRRGRYESSKLGWAAQTLPSVCYEGEGAARRYPSVCARRFSWGSAREDMILPEAHTVSIALSPEQKAAAGAGECAWSWSPRSGTGKREARKLACKASLTIPRVPFALDRGRSGVAVSVTLPDGRVLEEPHVVVDDVLVVAMGDSFASGESNPDRPVTFSGSRQMVYDPVANRDEQHAARAPANGPVYGVASADAVDPKVLPRRRLADEEQGRMLPPSSDEFHRAFHSRGARWLSADCHRSQYGYPVRVGMQLALENRQRSVTLVTFACSGAEVVEGLFREMPAREGNPPKVRAQFDQLSDLICRSGAAGRTQRAAYAVPVHAPGSTTVAMQTLEQRWCPPAERKRPVDLVLLSIGGNDVGFGALAAYAMTDTAADIAPIAGLIGHQIRFGPDVARIYLNHVDKRMQAVKLALRDGFGVEPSRVVQNAYEPATYDERGQVCGSQPTLGMDVHPNLKLNQARVAETAAFFKDFVQRLECTANSGAGRCPAGLATGAGTGFAIVTAHHAKFAQRGLCARDPKRAIQDGLMMAVPRKSPASDEFAPYSPDDALPYASRWRLFRTPNDAFMAANTHSVSVAPFDIMQPAYAGLYGGVAHPTAEAHAIVADHVMRYARSVLARRPDIEVRSVLTTGAR